jgi:hypothetical protein
VPLCAALAAFLHAYAAGLGRLGIEVISVSAPFTEAGWPRWSAWALVAGAPAVFEEVGFRGLVQGRLAETLGARGALAVQAALFAFLHLTPAIFPSHFLVGLALGWLRVATGSLWPGMAVHAALNGLVLLGEGC